MKCASKVLQENKAYGMGVLIITTLFEKAQIKLMLKLKNLHHHSVSIHNWGKYETWCT